jgi:peptide methionine sulfoxide reductase msrA/msrB
MRIRTATATGVALGLLIVGLVFSGSKAADKEGVERTMKDQKQLEIATLAGGCFWCVEADFEKVEGVVKVISGYSGGNEESPTYEQVSSGRTGHVEAVQVHYDPSKLTYREILDVFWRHVDPTDPGGQFVDRGSQYRTMIFYHDDEQRRVAEESKRDLDKSGRFKQPIATEVVKFSSFYPAEEYHQDYYKTNPLRYKVYRLGSGRDRFMKEAWGDEKKPDPGSSKGAGYAKPGDDELKRTLTPLQYKVTQQEGTEPPLTTNTGTTKGRASTWTSYPASLFSARRINTTRAPDGRVSQKPWCRRTSWKNRTAVFSWFERKCAASTPTPIWGTCFPTARRPPD